MKGTKWWLKIKVKKLCENFYQYLLDNDRKVGSLTNYQDKLKNLNSIDNNKYKVLTDRELLIMHSYLSSNRFSKLKFIGYRRRNGKVESLYKLSDEIDREGGEHGNWEKK